MKKLVSKMVAWYYVKSKINLKLNYRVCHVRDANRYGLRKTFLCVNSANNLFKSDSQRVAFLLCVGLSG